MDKKTLLAQKPNVKVRLDGLRKQFESDLKSVNKFFIVSGILIFLGLLILILSSVDQLSLYDDAPESINKIIFLIFSLCLTIAGILIIFSSLKYSYQLIREYQKIDADLLKKEIDFPIELARIEIKIQKQANGSKPPNSKSQE